MHNFELLKRSSPHKYVKNFFRQTFYSLYPACQRFNCKIKNSHTRCLNCLSIGGIRTETGIVTVAAIIIVNIVVIFYAIAVIIVVDVDVYVVDIIVAATIAITIAIG